MIEYLKSRFRDHSKLSISIAFLFTISLFIIIAQFILSYYQYTINKTVDKKEANRTLIILGTSRQIKYDELKELEKTSHVVNIYEEYSNWNLKDGKNFFIPQNNYQITSLHLGRNIENKKEVLINKTAENDYKLSLGDTLYLNNKYKYQIVGFTNDDGAPTIYLENQILREIAFKENAHLSKINLVVDEYQYLNSVIKELHSKGYEANINETLDQEVNSLEKIIDNLKYGIYAISFFSIIISLSILNYLLKNEAKNNALLKLIGYKNKKIVIMNFIYLLAVLIMTFFIEFVTYFFLKLILDFINIYTISYIKYLNIISFIFIINIIILIVLSIENYFYLKKIDMLNIIEES